MVGIIRSFFFFFFLFVWLLMPVTIVAIIFEIILLSNCTLKKWKGKTIMNNIYNEDRKKENRNRMKMKRSSKMF